MIKIGHILLLFGIIILCHADNPADSDSPLEDKDRDLCYYFIENLTNSSYVGPNVSPQVKNFFLYSGHNLNDLGDYDSCFPLPLQKYSLLEVKNKNNTYSIGICGPSYCNVTELQNNFDALLRIFSELTGQDLTKYEIYFEDPEATKIEKGFWLYFAIIIYLILFTLIISGTIAANFKKEKLKTPNSLSVSFDNKINLSEALLLNKNSANSSANDEALNIRVRSQRGFKGNSESKPLPESSFFAKLSKSFDLAKNIREFFSKEQNPDHDQNLSAFHGIRVLALLFGIYGNTFLFIHKAKNYAFISIFMKSWWMLSVAGAIYTVDTFFYLGGFLSGYIIIAKLKKIHLDFDNYFIILFQRWMRLWPAYFLVILTYWKIVVYVGNGPLWYNFINSAQHCSTSAWQNLLFLDNALAKDYQCLSWGWYLATDFQIYLLVPLIGWIYIHGKTCSYFTICVLFLVSCSNSYKESIQTGVSMLIAALENGFDVRKYLVNYHQNTIVRMSPYLIGLLCGFLYKQYKEGKVNIFTKIKKAKHGTILAVIGVVLLIFIIYFPRTIQVGIQWPEVAEILWSTFSKPLWAIGIFLVTAPCLVGNQSLLNRFLSHYYFAALSKISYSSYLVHFALIQMLVYGSHQCYSLSKNFQLRIVLFISLTSFIGGFIIYLMIEKPIHNLVKKRGKIDSLKN